MKFIGAVGQWCLEAFESMGQFVFMVRSAAFWIFQGEIEWRQTVTQMMRIGVDSLPVSAMTSFFTGMVMSLQSASTMQGRLQ